MLFAKIDNQLTRATTDGPRRAICMCCNSEVVAKTGDINIHHWAHAVDANCIMNNREMGEWHVKMQSLFDDSEIEVRDDKWPNNVADICISINLPDYDYLVIEAQHSPISAETVKQREDAYKNLIWVVDMNARTEIPASFNAVSPRRIISEKNGVFYNKYIGEKLDNQSLREFAIQLFTCDITTTPIITSLKRRLNALELETDYYRISQQQLIDKINTINQEISAIFESASLLNVEIPQSEPQTVVLTPSTSVTFPHVQYLDVSIAEKDLVKALGAKWNPTFKKWYCPPGIYSDKILKWCRI